MVCAKCQKTQEKTKLATPRVKHKNDIYYGSSTSGSKSSSPATLGQNGVGKSKLLSKSAKNPYAAYSSSCDTCKTKIDQGHTFCHKCAYKAGNACAVCGKSQNKGTSTPKGQIIQGQRFSAK
ncbi:hypothetical protein N7G274_006837 [Stereocaulon virgatum]|uniref:Cysteine-rich PDZ-binding protein n=1 Tax=Stereocaulon virgatum TaxID=373712 RepID=A0ABR4A389_9LECA